MKMQILAVTSVAISLVALLASLTPKVSARKVVETETRGPGAQPPAPTLEDLSVVSPALERYRQGPLMGDLWNRPGLSRRDRCIVTLATLIARNQSAEMPYYLNLALDSGVKPREISEIITHLAFYSGWGNAMSAVAVTKDVFARRHIGADQLPQASPPPLTLNEAAEADRATRVAQQFGAVAPGVVQYTTDVLFRDLWLSGPFHNWL